MSVLTSLHTLITDMNVVMKFELLIISLNFLKFFQGEMMVSHTSLISLNNKNWMHK